MSNALTFLADHWLAILIICVVLGVLVGGAILISGALPAASMIAAWSMQEAVFYGFCVLAFATFVS